MTQAPTGRTRGFVALGLMGFIALGLTVVLVLSVTAIGVFEYRRHHLTDKPFSLTNSGDSLTNADVSAVKKVTTQFALRMDDLSSKDVAGYVKSVGEVLTTRCRTDFDKTGAVLASSIGTVQFTTKGFVRAVGIAAIDRDSATAMIVHDSEKTASGGQALVSAYRWTVTLLKVDGKWQVDKFVDPDRGGEAC